MPRVSLPPPNRNCHLPPGKPGSVLPRLREWACTPELARGLTLATLLLAGCSLFSPRTPEPPSENPTPWNEPVSPTIVLANLDSAYEYRDLTSYMRSFDADSFSFQADPRDTSDPAIAVRYRGWSFDVEREVSSKIFAQSDSIRLDSLSVSADSSQEHFGTSEAILYRRYHLRIYSAQARFARGIARFSLRSDQSGYWRIVRWEDVRTDTTDWGQLKGEFR